MRIILVRRDYGAFESATALVERYDVAVIGAGADGLAASAILARAGLKTALIERSAQVGGRCQTHEFHPGYRASPFSDELAPVPAGIFHDFGLARRGAFFVPAPFSTALWPDGRRILVAGSNPFFDRAAKIVRASIARAEADAQQERLWPRLRSGSSVAPWPSQTWSESRLADLAHEGYGEGHDAAHAIALALEGRSADASLIGSALHLVAPGVGGSGLMPGGLATLTTALLDIAKEAGVELRCGLDVADIRHERGRVRSLSLADGLEISVRAVISTLDIKRTFLSLFHWSSLPKPLVRRVNTFRMGGSTARLLLALESPPEIPGGASSSELARGPIVVAPDLQDLTTAHAAWSRGTIPNKLPLVVRVLSSVDPRAAPIGRATVTVTIGSVPQKLFDGAWTREKREQLKTRAMAALEQVMPGTKSRVVADQLLTPTDIEETLGLTDGDLWGGEIAPDQMEAMRPWVNRRSPRTALKGLYLAGPSTMAGLLGTCLSGVVAARAVASDIKRGGSL